VVEVGKRRMALKKRYEGVYFLSDSLKAEAVDVARENVRTDIKKVGGAILSEKPVERRPFARPIRKQQAAYYWEIIFELDADKVVALKHRHKLDANVFRVMIVSPRKVAKVDPKKVLPEQKQAVNA
jgi:ribosomal protein S6